MHPFVAKITAYIRQLVQTRLQAQNASGPIAKKETHHVHALQIELRGTGVFARPEHLEAACARMAWPRTLGRSAPTRISPAAAALECRDLASRSLAANRIPAPQFGHPTKVWEMPQTEPLSVS